MVLNRSEVVVGSGATKTTGGTEAVAELINRVHSINPDAQVTDDRHDNPWLRFANGQWGRALSRVYLDTSLGMLAIYVMGVPHILIMAGTNLCGTRESSFCNDEL